MGGFRAWGEKVGVGEATIERMIKGKADVRLDSIEAVARGFGLQAWQLLVPDLDPRNPPVYLSDGERDLYQRFRQLTRDIKHD